MLKMKHLEDLCSQVMLWVIFQVASNMMSKSWNPVLKSAIKSTSKITSASKSPWDPHGFMARPPLLALLNFIAAEASRYCPATAAAPMQLWLGGLEIDAEMGCEIGGFQGISGWFNGDEMVVLVAIPWELVGFEQQQWWSICDYSTK